MATYLVKTGSTYATVRDLQAAVTLNSGDIVQLDDSAGTITETSGKLGLAAGVTYTSLSSRAAWSVDVIGLNNSTVVRNLRFINTGSNTDVITTYDSLDYYMDAVFDRNFVESRNRISNLSAYGGILINRWMISNNIFILNKNFAGGAIDFRAAGPQYLYIYNNVFYVTFSNIGAYCIYTNGDGWGVYLSVFKNNIIQGNGVGYGIYINSAESVPAIDYNCVFNFGTNFYGTPGIHNLESDPLFVNAGGNDFHLGGGSPCAKSGISKNSDSYVPVNDYDGKPRRSSDIAMGVYHTKPISFFDSTSVTDGTPISSYLTLSEVVGTIQGIGTDSYFDSESKIGKVVVYYEHQSGREQKRLYFDQDHTSSVVWSPLARDGTWQKTLVKVYDREGAVTTISRAYIDSTGEDLVHSGGQTILNVSYL